MSRPDVDALRTRVEDAQERYDKALQAEDEASTEVHCAYADLEAAQKEYDRARVIETPHNYTGSMILLPGTTIPVPRPSVEPKCPAESGHSWDTPDRRTGEELCLQPYCGASRLLIVSGTCPENNVYGYMAGPRGWGIKGAVIV